mmetsp:Transcript_430/g.817  ORF Transcript_430/g.817 Transcript_430/m.817 type:complete len:219 (-) Transcript_430:616-1272(-)
MLKNFSMPISAPNPASVIQNPSLPVSLRAIWSATIEEFPWAMLANGPACTNTGVCSMVCMRVGIIASFISTSMAPPTPRSSAVTGIDGRPLLSLLMPITMRPNLSRMSSKEVVRARIAITSEATEISKPVARGLFSLFPTPTVTPRTYLSQTSSTRCQVIVSGSMSNRAKRDISSSVRSSGFVLLIPSLSKRRSITGANLRFPFLSFGHRRLNKEWSL